MERPGCLWCDGPRAWALPPGASTGLSFLVWKIGESNAAGIPNSALPWPDKISTGSQRNEGGKTSTRGAFPRSQPDSV